MTPPVELPIASPPPTVPVAPARQVATISRERYRELAGRVRLLSWLSLAAMSVERVVAIQFFLLAPYVAVESLRALLGAEHPEVSGLGMALAAWSLVTMPLLGVAKQHIAEEIGSAATKGEGRQNLLCAYLAGALLVGLAGNALAGAWWLDPMVGLLIAGVAVKEGLEAWRGDGCCVDGCGCG